MSLLKYAIRRMLMVIPVVFGVIVLTFILSRIMPGNPFLEPSISIKGDPDFVRRQLEFYGFNEPIYIQFLLYLENMFRGNWGESYAIAEGVPVWQIIGPKLPITLELGLYSILLSTVIGVRAGVYSALHKNKPGDAIVRTLAILGASVPIFVLGILSQNYLAIKLHLFPTSGLKSLRMSDPMTITSFRLLDCLITGEFLLFFDTVWHLILPVFTLVVAQLADVTRISRSSMLEVLDLDYIRSARAKGCEEKDVIKKHALKNALIPTVTVIGVRFALIFGGAILMETTFNLKGFGMLFVDAIMVKDYFVINALVFVISIVFTSIMVVVDILYAVIDPRIRY